MYSKVDAVTTNDARSLFKTP